MTVEPQPFTCPDPKIAQSLAVIEIGVKEGAKHLKALSGHVEKQNNRLGKLEADKLERDVRAQVKNEARMGRRWQFGLLVPVSMAAILAAAEGIRSLF